MKSIQFLLFSLCFLFLTQYGWTQGVGGGLTGGVITSQIDGDDWGGYNKWGYQFGGFAFYDFSEHLALQIEILHTHRGSREANAFGQINLNYIDVPVLLRYNLPLGNGLLTPEAGISANILLSARSGFDNLQLDVTDFYRRYTTEMHLGTAYYFNDNIGIFGRWSLGLSNLNDLPVRRPWLTIYYFTFGVRARFK